MNLDHSAITESKLENLSICRLCADVTVVTWDIPSPARASSKCKLEIPVPPVPLISVGIPLESGDIRMFWAMRTGSEPVEFSLSASPLGPTAQAILYPANELAPFDAEHTLADLTLQGHIKFLTTLLTTWRSAFRLSRNQTFAALLHDITLALTPEPREAQSCGEPVQGHHLLETAVDPMLGDITAIYGISPGIVTVIPPRFAVGKQGRKNWQPCHLLLEGPQGLPSSLLLVLSGPKGVAVRKLAAKAQEPAEFTNWWTKWHGNGELREFLVRELGRLGAPGAAVAIDLQTRAPLPVRQIAQSASHPAAEIDLALALDGGLIVGGWFQDPATLLTDLEYLPESGNAVSLKPHFHKFSGKVAKRDNNPQTDVTGFVAWLPSAKNLGPLLQPRFQMRLASGATAPLTPLPQPFEPSAQRNRILRAVPPQHARPNVFGQILAPALTEVEKKLGATVQISEVKDYGSTPLSPLASIVIPLYRNLDFLRFQFSAMATDPWLMENAELIFVLDSPEILDDTEHMLGGLHILHDLPFRFVIMNRNGGYARACNAGASVATGTTIIMLNSDVVPGGHGWLQHLIQPLFDRPKLGAIGPRLLFEDGSLQHAGLYFARDRQGIWLNHHYYKGMPSNYAPALKAREVPGITGACLVTRKDIFDLVGGYTEDYIIGDYEDSDLCLKIRQLGFQVFYDPSVALYHFERRSIRRSADYMRGLASQYNSWLHTQRWNDDITELMAPPQDGDQITDPSNVIVAKSERTAA
ncbi:glycosyltransferase family 2 protein [Falsochrobactrum sp. TDYN1]|uniref:Glycosyltransferase family 2 protein n=1 Tax=Falsochrobactrum tianjinense TaxID=2706015 RepID=A0A949PLN3_9HYPH|nr:glycosyltransferase family 2 protein [Falsochrobactrum sp. TDYN1]MBV2143527.1 glycosyltransferase family 2 protein [Falsochrobactrum sp. TDYN1]